MPTATATRPKSKPKAKPRARRAPVAERVEVDDSLERKYRAQVERQGERSTADYVDEAYEEGLAEGAKRSTPGTPAPAKSSPGSGLSSLPAGSLGVGSMMAPLVVETVLITGDEFLRFHRWPVPSRYLAAFFIFGGLSLASSSSAARAARVTAWGLVLATTYAFVSNGANVLAGIGDFFGGKPPTTTTTTTTGTPGTTSFSSTSTTAPQGLNTTAQSPPVA